MPPRADVPSRRGRERVAAAPPPLSRERIVVAAFAVIEAAGLARFSMRRLAASLGCEAMSLYHHFAGKRELIDALVDHAIASQPPIADDAPPLDRVRAAARAFRALAHRYPAFFPLLAVHRLNTSTGVAWIERTLASCVDATGDARSGAELFRAVGYFVTGAGLDESAGYSKGPSAARPVADATIARDHPLLAGCSRYFKPDNWDSIFERGLDAILASVERVPRRGRSA